MFCICDLSNKKYDHKGVITLPSNSWLWGSPVIHSILPFTIFVTVTLSTLLKHCISHLPARYLAWRLNVGIFQTNQTARSMKTGFWLGWSCTHCKAPKLAIRHILTLLEQRLFSHMGAWRVPNFKEKWGLSKSVVLKLGPGGPLYMLFFVPTTIAISEL